MADTVSQDDPVFLIEPGWIRRLEAGQRVRQVGRQRLEGRIGHAYESRSEKRRSPQVGIRCGQKSKQRKDVLDFVRVEESKPLVDVCGDAPALEFLISWAGDDVQANFQVSKYISLVGLMVAAFGIAFEFPVLLVFLQLVGVVTPQQLAKQWRYAIVIIFVIAAVITPSGDPYSMMALAGPMTIFYLISILIGLFAQKRKRAREAAEA